MIISNMKTLAKELIRLSGIENQDNARAQKRGEKLKKHASSLIARQLNFGS